MTRAGKVDLLAGTALVNESIHAKSRGSSRRQSNQRFQVMMQMALMQKNRKDAVQSLKYESFHLVHLLPFNHHKMFQMISRVPFSSAK